jgi:hypothetical protein
MGWCPPQVASATGPRPARRQFPFSCRQHERTISGEQVVDVPAKLAARVRLFDTGHNRKTDAVDAHSIAMVAIRTSGLREVVVDDELEVLRMLTDRRDELARHRVRRSTGSSGCWWS